MDYIKRWILVIFVVMAAMAVASSAIAASPLGTSPNDPLMVPTGSSTIAANTTQWFYFDYGVSSARGGPGPGGRPGASSKTGSTANITVDANGNKGLQFAIYTPTQGKEWVNNTSIAPVGRGTPYVNTSSGTVTHDLNWAGSFNTSGRYLIALTNSSGSPITYQMAVTGDAVALYPAATPSPTATLYIPVTVTPVPTTTITGKIVFETATGGEIYTVNGDGTDLARVSHGIDPAWSPDGKQIVFARWDSPAPAVYIADANGANEHIIYGGSRVRSPRWSPDGKYIVFTQEKTKDDRNPVRKLGVIEVATGKLTEPECSRLAYAPSWGSDSTTIYYFDPSVGIMKASTLGGPAQLVLGPKGTYMDTAANVLRPILNMPEIQSVEVSPDGQRLAFSQEAHDRWEVNTANADGGNQAAITSPDPILSILYEVVVHNTTPTWSPDGKQILFLSDRNGEWEFFVANADGSNVRQVLKNVTDVVSVKFSYENERTMDWTR